MPNLQEGSNEFKFAFAVYESFSYPSPNLKTLKIVRFVKGVRWYCSWNGQGVYKLLLLTCWVWTASKFLFYTRCHDLWPGQGGGLDWTVMDTSSIIVVTVPVLHHYSVPWYWGHRTIWSKVRWLNAAPFPLFRWEEIWHEQQWRDLTLMSDIPMVPSVMWGFIWSHSLPMNWCGITKTRIFAPLTASVISGTATWRTSATNISLWTQSNQNKWVDARKML